MSEVSGGGPEDGFVEVEFRVEPNYAGWRLDKYLRVKIPRLSRSRIQGIIKKSLLSDKKLKPSSLIRPGLMFRLRRRMSEEPETPSSLIELYRDDALLVLDKPAGLPIHPSARYHHGTLVMLLRRLYGDGFQAWPAHRLDRETSGLVVCGRTKQAARILMEDFSTGRVEKEYLAICEGQPPEFFTVDAPIAEGSANVRIAVRIDPRLGKRAVTRFTVLRRFERDGAPFALVRASPETGRQHQIRIHLREAGFPIVGDKIYGPDEGIFDRFSKRRLEPEAWRKLRLPRQALHAASIRFAHPSTRAMVSFRSPLPDDLEQFIGPEPARRSAAGLSQW
jgi:23S rRNA pseudouridine1911/1915/1917 synthase